MALHRCRPYHRNSSRTRNQIREAQYPVVQVLEDPCRGEGEGNGTLRDE